MQCVRFQRQLQLAPDLIRRISSATIYGRTYTINEQSQILEKLNESSLEELAKYDISQSRVKKIYDFKAKNNKFAQLDDCLQLDGFGEKILNKFYDSILGNKLKTIERKMSSVVTPKLSIELRKMIQTCTSVNICVNNISWSKVEILENEKLSLIDCHLFPLENKKYQFTELLEVASNVGKMIPASDVYVMENPTRHQTMMSNINATKINVNVEKAQLNAAIGALLLNRNNDEIVTNLYFLKQFSAAKLFNTFIGNEKTSNKSVVLNLLGEDKSSGWTDIASELDMQKLAAPDSIRNKYLNSSDVEKEFMGQSLLLNLAFIKLGIFE